MTIETSDNYVIVPNPTDLGKAIYYQLSAATDYSSNSFVIIPYQNPHSEPIKPQFFKILNQTCITLKSFKPTKQNIVFSARTSKDSYYKTVSELKKHIALGNIYEINYCIEFFSERTIIDPINVLIELQKIAKAPYAALAKIGDEFIITASPELFLKKTGNIISTKPIKGTIRRGKSVEEDEELKELLRNNLKERTENVMAVDVARNDLSKIAERGTVTVNKLYNIESFETVHQMVSTVSCQVPSDLCFNTLVKATFPMASMTGAPKTKAMSLIDAFENFKRHYYSGAMGLIDEHGNFNLSVVIRSIFWNQKSNYLSLAVGGAITNLSDPEKEYDECLLKAKTMLKALNATIDQSTSSTHS